MTTLFDDDDDDDDLFDWSHDKTQNDFRPI